MSKIIRNTGNTLAFGINSPTQFRKIFGGNVASDVLDDNITLDYLEGWDAVAPIDPTTPPVIQDFNAVSFTISQQIAYLMQQGIPEWDSSQEYFLGSMANRNGLLYAAIIDNVGDDPLTSNNWSNLSGSSVVLVNSIAELREYPNPRDAQEGLILGINKIKGEDANFETSRATCTHLGDGSVILFSNGNKVDVYKDATTVIVGTTLALTLSDRSSATFGDGSMAGTFGGGSGAGSSSVEFYTNATTKVAGTPLSESKLSVGVATFGDGKIGVFGGETNVKPGLATDIVEVYTNATSKVIGTPLNTGKRNVGVATFGDGSIGVFGGDTSNGSLTNEVEVYTNATTKVVGTPLNIARDGVATATFGDGSIGVFGGLTTGGPSTIVEIYTNATTKFSGTSLSISRYKAAASTLSNGNIIVFGGGINNIIVEMYKSDGSKVILQPLSNTSSQNPASATFGNGDILVATGSGTPADSVDVYHEANLSFIYVGQGVNQWFKRPNQAQQKVIPWASETIQLP